MSHYWFNVDKYGLIRSQAIVLDTHHPILSGSLMYHRGPLYLRNLYDIQALNKELQPVGT